MANLKLIAKDQSADVWTYSNTTDSSYPLTNLNDYNIKSYWLSSAVASGDALKLTLIASSEQGRTRNGIAVGYHNFSGLMSGAGNIKVQSSTDGTTWTDRLILPSTLSDPFFLPLTTSAATTYWRLLFNGTTNGGAKPFAGVIMIDEILDFGFPYDFPYKKENKQYKTIERETMGGLLRTYQTMPGRSNFSYTFRAEKGGISDATATAWRSFYDRIRGKLRPFFMLDADGTSVYYVHLDSDVDSLEAFRYNVNSLELKFKKQWAE